MQQFANKQNFEGKKESIIYFNGCIEKKNWNPKMKGKFVIFRQKLALRENLDISFKSKGISVISETT